MKKTKAFYTNITSPLSKYVGFFVFCCFAMPFLCTFNVALGHEIKTETCTPVPVTEGTLETDRRALMAIYTALDGPNWTWSARDAEHNWGTDKLLSDWAGVFVENGRVTRLTLDGLNVKKDALPAEIANLDKLRILHISKNLGSTNDKVSHGLTSLPDEIGALVHLEDLHLTENHLSSLPESMCNLTNLKELHLDRNDLSGSMPSWLFDLAVLKKLTLTYNALSGVLPGDIGDLDELTHLDLHGNQLSGTIPTQIEKLDDLIHLDLSRNQLSGTIPTQIEKLDNLTILALAINQLSGSIPTQIEKLVELRWLDLHNNQLSGSIPTQIEKLVNLERLSFGGNQLTGRIPTQIKKLEKLTFLDLRDNQLSDTIPTQIEKLEKLTFLDLGGNQLSGNIPTQIGDLTNLEVLRLWDNELSGAIPPKIWKLAHLKTLNLANNRLEGSLPAQLKELAKLEYLLLNGNELTGVIPSGLGQLSSLKILQLSDNKLRGRLPDELGNISSLVILRVYRNDLSGYAPKSLHKLTNILAIGFTNTTICPNPDPAFQAWMTEHNFSSSFPPGVTCQESDPGSSEEGIFSGGDEIESALTEEEQDEVAYFQEDPATVRSMLTKIDVASLRSAEQLVLPSFFGSGITLTRTSIETLDTDEFRWQGTSMEPEGMASILVYQEYAQGILYVNERSYAIEYVGGGDTYLLLEFDESLEVDENDDADDNAECKAPFSASALSFFMANKFSNEGNVASEEETVIRVAVAYTKVAARVTLYSSIKQALEETNTTYRNSKINKRLELARTFEVDVEDLEKNRTESGSKTKKPLDDYIKIMRSEQALKDLSSDYSVDLGGLIVRYARITGSVSGASIKHEFLKSGGEPSADNHKAYFYVRRGMLRPGRLIFAHEIGHLGGAHHNIEDTDRHWDVRGFGHCNCESGFGTIMSYCDYCTDDDVDIIPFWSDPDKTYQSTFTIAEAVLLTQEEKDAIVSAAVKLGATDQTSKKAVQWGRTSEESKGPFSSNNRAVLRENASIIAAFVDTPDELDLDKIAQSPKAYEFGDAIAKTTVRAEGAFVVKDKAIVHLRAGEKVILNPGFSVKKGGKFRARVEPELKDRN